MRLAEVDCLKLPSLPIDIVMSMVMLVAVLVPVIVPSIFSGLVHDILYENLPPLSEKSFILQSLSSLDGPPYPLVVLAILLLI